MILPHIGEGAAAVLASFGAALTLRSPLVAVHKSDDCLVLRVPVERRRTQALGGPVRRAAVMGGAHQPGRDCCMLSILSRFAPLCLPPTACGVN